jgi:hypothetical protein
MLKTAALQTFFELQQGFVSQRFQQTTKCHDSPGCKQLQNVMVCHGIKNEN